MLNMSDYEGNGRNLKGDDFDFEEQYIVCSCNKPTSLRAVNI
jgi:hypothetical protein